MTICPLQFTPFIFVVCRSNSATQHISPVSFILLGICDSGVWEPCNQTDKLFHMMKWLCGSNKARNAQESFGRTLRLSVNSHPSTKCITSCSAVVVFITLLYYCNSVTAVQSWFINFPQRWTLGSVWVFILQITSQPSQTVVCLVCICTTIEISGKSFSDLTLLTATHCLVSSKKPKIIAHRKS